MVKRITNIIIWLTSGGLLLASLAFVAFATPSTGNRALIVRSGSMEPTMSVGDIVIVRAGNYNVGEAIAYRVPGRSNIVVTHRVVEIKDGAYITKGDANKAVDSWVVSASDIIGKELFVVPWVGKVLAFAKTKVGFLSLVLLPAFVVILSELWVIWRELRRKTLLTPTPSAYALGTPPSLRGSKRYLDGLSARVAVILLIISVMTPATWALFSDSATSTNNVFAAAASFGTDHLVISEVQVIGSNANQDFVELYNPTSNTVDLSGWKIRKRNVNGSEDSLRLIPSGKSIPAYGFFLWANSQSGYAASIGADESTTANITENDSVALRMPDDTIVDQIGWSNDPDIFFEGMPITTNTTNNQSYERKAYSTSTAASMTGADATKGNGFDSDNNSTDFVLRAASEPQNSGSVTETP